MKALIRKWLELKDTHFMKCGELRIFGELITVSDPCPISEGDVIDVNGRKYLVEAHVLRVSKL